ncbi:MAG: hypothetical protein ACLUQX_15295, partial [Thomasclavelia spiroformis]
FYSFSKRNIATKNYLIINIKAKTMKENEELDSIQPMWSVFEQFQLSLLDFVITQLIERNNITEERYLTIQI